MHLLRKRSGILICEQRNEGSNTDATPLECYTPSTGTRKFSEGLNLHQESCEAQNPTGK
jgi:hypothetical protein